MDVIGMDAAVAEIADQEIAGETAEPVRGDGESPGRVERTMRRDALDQVAVEVELVDEAMAEAPHVVRALRVADREGDEEMTVERLHVERRVSVRHVRIGEALHRVEVIV